MRFTMGIAALVGTCVLMACDNEARTSTFADSSPTTPTTSETKSDSLPTEPTPVVATPPKNDEASDAGTLDAAPATDPLHSQPQWIQDCAAGRTCEAPNGEDVPQWALDCRDGLPCHPPTDF